MPILRPSSATSEKSKANNAKNSTQSIITSIVSNPYLSLEKLPQPLVYRILNFCVSELYKLRMLSNSWKYQIDIYLDARMKRWKEMCEEADAWGHRPPSLNDLIYHDPLVVELVLENVYEPKLTKFTRSLPNKILTFQKSMFKLLQQTIEYYPRLNQCVPVLMRSIRRIKVHYELTNVSIAPQTPQLVESESVSEELSTRQESETVTTLPCIPSLYNGTKKDIQWCTLCNELFILACVYGNQWDVPAIADLEESTVVSTISRAVEGAVRGKNALGSAIALESARISGCFWAVLEIGLDVAIEVGVADRGEGMKNVGRVLERFVFDDEDGPGKAHATEKYDKHGKAFALILKADELAKVLMLKLGRGSLNSFDF